MCNRFISIENYSIVVIRHCVCSRISCRNRMKTSERKGERKSLTTMKTIVISPDHTFIINNFYIISSLLLRLSFAALFSFFCFVHDSQSVRHRELSAIVVVSFLLALLFALWPCFWARLFENSNRFCSIFSLFLLRFDFLLLGETLESFSTALNARLSTWF